MNIIQIEDHRMEIEAIKLSVEMLSHTGLSLNNTFVMSIQYLLKYYNLSNDKGKGYLVQAAIQIQAYMELGFIYEDHSMLFDEVARALGTTKKEMYPKEYYHSKKVSLTKSSVRSMLGRWPSTKNRTTSINQIVDEIIEKVKLKEKGIYRYECTHSTKSQIKSMYELVII